MYIYKCVVLPSGLLCAVLAGTVLSIIMYVIVDLPLRACPSQPAL